MFKDRFEAGEKLALKLRENLSEGERKEALVLGIPRGGVAVGAKIAADLGLPFDCLVIKRLRAPENEDVTIGAVGEGGVIVWEESLCRKLSISPAYQQAAVKKKVLEFAKKETDFRATRPAPVLAGKRVILVDDGSITGATAKAALAVVRSFKPKEIIVAVPIIAPDALEEIKNLSEKTIYLEVPEMFFGLEQFYEDFRQPGDEEIRKLLVG